jgi:hypothetical protein
MAREGVYMTTIFRHPRGHVYSMYLQNAQMCKNGGPDHKIPRGDSQEEGFAEWVDHFYKGLTPDGGMNVTNSYGCYHPYNLQARAFSPLCTAENNINHTRGPRAGNNGFSPQIQTVPMMQQHLADNMYKLHWLGITEFYEAGMCIFQHLTGTPYFETCDAEAFYAKNLAQFEPPSTSSKKDSKKKSHRRALKTKDEEKPDKEPSHITHGISDHPHLAVPDHVWRQVDALTKYDRKLYWLAMRRFACGVAAFETSTNKSLEHLLPMGGWEYLYDIADIAIRTDPDYGEEDFDKE